MFDKLSIENEFNEFQALEKHKYPLWIYVFFICIIASFLSVVPSFLLYELSNHRELGQKIAYANKCFLSQDYENAVKLYVEFLKRHPNFIEARIGAIKSYFALSSQDLNFYLKGMDLLGDEKYTSSRISQMSSFLPLKYQEHFKSLFEMKL